ncbi:DUF1542 domain-containing protein [Apilactobacillus kunkeei]|uniref:DUF1542 domain-containing protein n=1 Tax=Apilactobacillus kunkeei TaxID=148814 RepID=UPI001C89A199|nr:DUF1542 domain-containing protein [Apilactobacillus kunkeei]MBX8456237.1 DUF1542 domain-containing protein [Apilactobacillus kunkeei]
MNKNSFNQFNQFNPVKTHFKMYKSGKLWLVSGISLLGIGLTNGIAASADDTTTSSENVKVNDQQPHYDQKEVTLGSDQSQSQVNSVSTSQSGMNDASLSASQSQSQSASLSAGQSQSQSASLSAGQSQSQSASAVASQAQQDSKNSVKSSGDLSESSADQGQAKSEDSSLKSRDQKTSQSNSQNDHSTLVHTQSETNSTSNILSEDTSQSSSQMQQQRQSTGLDLSATQTKSQGFLSGNNQAQNASQTDSQTTSQSESQSQEVSNAVNLYNLAGNARTAMTPDQLRASKLTTTDDVKSEENIKVSPDPDPNRKNFESTIGNSTGSTPTSVNVPLPDQIANDANYKKNATDVSNYGQLVSAWGNTKTSYINIVNDITYDATKGDMPYRPDGASDIIVNGNNHTIDLARQSFRFYNITDNKTNATFTNANFQQGFGRRVGGGNTGDNDGNAYSLVYADTGTQLTVNANNVSLKPSDSNGNNPIHFIMSIGSKVNFSGTNYFNISNEVSRGVGNIVFANNAKVTMQRTNNDIGFSEFYFQNNITDTSAVGYGNTITMGDGSSNEAYTYQGQSASYPAMYLYVKGVQAGDNVTWKQSGFQYFLNTNQGGWSIPDNATFNFGQNFQLSAPITTQPGAIQIRARQQVTFNAGTVLDINQRSAAAVIQTADSSQVQFISPKNLHLAIQNSDGTPAATGSGIFSGSGTTVINNSSINTWQANNSASNVPNGDNSAKFATLKIQGGVATLTTVQGEAQSTNVLSSTTRELQTKAIANGSIYVQYVDQNGQNIGQPVKVPLSDDNYIGQFIPLQGKQYAEDNVPDGYMWAIGNQVYAQAKNDKQSGGDKTSTSDDGDQYGQATSAIVPMENTTYTYKLYVYGKPQDVYYRYVDAATGRVLSSPISGQTGSESIANHLVTANLGNVINWKDSYYTTTNVPAGYHYDANLSGQADTLKVTDNNGLTTILVVGNKQNVPLDYQDTSGKAVTPNTAITLSGVTGQTVTIPKAPSANNLALDHVLLNGQKANIGDSFELGNGTDRLTYVYHSLEIEKGNAKQTIDQEAAKVKNDIANDPTLDDQTRKTQQGNVDTEATKAKSNIDAATDESGVNTATQTGVQKIDDQHVSGASVDDLKKDAKAAIDQEAAKVKNDIANDPTLDDQAKKTQQGNVDTEANKAKDNIDQATDKQGIDNATTAGITAIDAQHVSGTKSVDDLKKDAKVAIDQEAAKVKNDIANDSTLDDATKKTQQGNVDTEANKAKANIDQATDKQGIDNATKAGITAIDAQHIAGTKSVDDLKKDVKAAIDQEAAKVKNDIANDPTLDNQTKQTQQGNVDTEANKAKANIDQATDKQGIDNATKAGITAIDAQHVSGTKSVDDLKKDAKVAIDQEAAKVKQDIANDPTLDDATKKTQQGNVDTEVNKAKANIDQATDKQGIDNATKAGITAIDAQHISGTKSVDDLKKDAKAAIDQEAAKVKQDIANDPTLDDQTKQTQQGNVDTEANKAKANIDQATDKQGIDNATKAGITAIDAQHVSGTKSVDDLKQDAKVAIDQEAAKVKNDIANDPTLDDATKQTQQGNVDTEANKAKANIDQSSNKQGIDNATAAGKQAIDAQHISGTKSIDDLKKAAKAAIDQEAAKVKNDIANDPTLDNQTKQTQQGNVDTEANKAKTNIDQATDKQGIDNATTAGITAIDAQHISGTKSVDDLKQDAKAAIDQEAAQVKSDIDRDITLDSTTKTVQKNNVDAEAKKAKTNIDNAQDKQGVDDAKKAGITAIDAQHVAGQLIDNQKDAAKTAIDAEAKKVKDEIAQDQTLTDGQKAEQTKGVNDEAKKAKINIDNATDAQGVKTATNDGKNQIDDQYVPGGALSDQKDAAKAAIDAEAKKIKDEIAQDKTLTDDQKATQSKAVNDAAKQAKTNIDNAKDAQGVKSATSDGKQAIDDQYVSGTALDAQKASAVQVIQAEAAKVKQAIANDPTLDDAAKKTQQGNVDSEATKAINAINAAENAQKIQDAQKAGITAIDAQHVPGTKSVDELKKDAQAAIDQEAKKIKEDIDQDPTLDNKTKETQKNNVDQAAKQAKDQINQATNKQGIDDAATAGKQAVDAQHVPGTKSVDEIKKDAQAAIDQEAKKIKEDIDQDPTLDNKTKETQKNNVDQAAKQAKEQINQATNKQGIDDVETAGKKAVDDQHVPGTKSVDELKKDAQAAIDQEAKKIKEDIDQDPTLDNKTKETQKNNVDQEATKAKDQINQATNKQGIDDATTAGKKAVDDQHVPGKTSVDEAKKAAEKAIDDEAKKIKDDIDQDPTLDNKTKETQKNNVDQEAKKAKDQINQAQDKQGVDDATAAGKTAVDSQHVPGAQQDEQKDAAKAAIDSEAKKVKDDIAQDSTLTDVEKANQASSVDNVAKAAKQAIDSAKDSQGIQKALIDGKTTIDAQHQSGSPLSNQKEAAKRIIDAEAAKVKNEISQDQTLTASEKAEQIRSVTAAATTAVTAIDNAGNVQEVVNATNDGKANIDAQHQPGAGLTDQKAAAIQAIQEAAAKAVKDSMGAQYQVNSTGESATSNPLATKMAGNMKSSVLPQTGKEGGNNSESVNEMLAVLSASALVLGALSGKKRKKEE